MSAPASPVSHASRVISVGVCALSLFMIAVDATVVNLALPVIGRALHAQVAGLQWTIAGYAVVTASLMPTSGSIGGRFGRRTVLQAGLAVFTFASAGCGMAPSVGPSLAGSVLASGLHGPHRDGLVAASQPAWLALAACGACVVILGLLVAGPLPYPGRPVSREQPAPYDLSRSG